MLGLNLSLGLASNSQVRNAVSRMVAALRMLGGSLWMPDQRVFGDGEPNLLTAPEFAAGLTDAPVSGGLVTASTLAGYDGALSFGYDGGTTAAWAYKQITHTAGLTYTVSVTVEMTDGLAPSWGAGSSVGAAAPFALVGDGQLAAAGGSEYVVAQLSGSTYRVSWTYVAQGTTANTGIVKYPANDNRTFKVTGYKLELGSVATAYTPQSVLRTRGIYTDIAGTTPVTAVADLIGLITDKSYGGQLGVELSSQDNATLRNNAAPTFDSLSGSTFSNSTDKVSVGYDNATISVVANKSYRITVPFSVASGSVVFSLRSGGALGTSRVASGNYTAGAGTWSVIYVATATEDLTLRVSSNTGAGATAVTLASRSVREVPGSHATQSAVASKPTVQRVPKRLGPNLVVNGTFDTNIDGWTSATGAGAQAWATGALRRAVGGGNGGSYIDVPVIAGKTYQVGGAISNLVGSGGAGIYFYTGGGFNGPSASLGATGTTTTVAATNNIRVYLYTDTTRGADFDNIEVREVLEWANVIQFDGSNDFLQTGITTGNEGWVCAGVTFGGALGSKETVFSSGAGAANLKGIWLTRLEGVSNQLRMGVGNGTELTMPVHAGIELLNAKRVVEGGWDATTVFAGVDGATTSLTRSGSASPSPNMLEIGRYVSGVHYFSGPMFATAYTPVLPSAADRKIIRDGIAALQGRTL